jgi:lysophospholipase L1-like esterase
MTSPLPVLTIALAVAGAFLASACSQGARVPTQAQVSPSPPRAVYAALGASETVGIGTEDPSRLSFPQFLYHRLPRSAVLYNLGLAGETATAAVQDELPPALAARPTLATVWFNVDDMAAGVAVAEYESRLDRIVGALRQAGTERVLVANSPRLDHLPAYLACRPRVAPSSVKCPLGDLTLPPPEEVRALVDAYNAATSRVAHHHGAIVVDLAAQDRTLQQHPEYISSDGLHPSAKGAAAIAAVFAAAMNG